MTTRIRPRNEHDLAIAAHNARLVSLDNISRLPEWLSDALCRIATGGGFSTRKLFTDSEESIFCGQRPILLNGITEVATRSDLLDRAIVVTLPPICEQNRRDELTFNREIVAAFPRIFGAVLDAVCAALREMPSTRLNQHPRMADFARWVVSAESALPWKPGEFMTAYSGNRAAGHELALDSSPVGLALIAFMEEIPDWSGTCTDLLKELNTTVDEQTTALKSWPKHPSTLGATLRRISSNLRALGVSVEFGSEGRGGGKRRTLTLRKGPQSVVPNDPGAPGPADKPGTSDEQRKNGADGADPAHSSFSPESPAEVSSAWGGADGDGGDDGDGKMRPESINASEASAVPCEKVANRSSGASAATKSTANPDAQSSLGSQSEE